VTNLRWDCDEGRHCYRDQLPDWTPFNDCFPRGIRISDIDGIVEIGCRFLMLEWKGSKTAFLHEGQRKMLKRFGRPPDAVLCLRGTLDDLQWLLFDGNAPEGWQDISLDEVKTWIKNWVTEASRAPWPEGSA
jgi:hypothetical protein